MSTTSTPPLALPSAQLTVAAARTRTRGAAAWPRQLLGCTLADLRERTRRGSFVVFLLATLGFGWLGFAGHVEMRLGESRGVLNSPWIGTLMAIATSFFVTMVGFYFVKGTIADDRRRGVGELLAATPLPTPVYLASKWLANAALFACAVAVLAGATGVLQWLRGEASVDALALLWPTLVLTLPAALTVAAFAVLFETVRWLRGGLGNVVWFFFWSFALVAAQSAGIAALDWVGIAVVRGELARDFETATGTPAGAFTYNIGGGEVADARVDFTWNGLDSDATTLVPRLGVVALAGVFALVGGLWFDRFATTATRPSGRGKATASPPTTGSTWQAAAALDGLPRVTRGLVATRLGGLLRAELAITIGGKPRLLWLLALVPTIAAVAAPAGIAAGWAVAAALAPILLWSQLGVRERLHGVDQLLFSSPRPVARQLLASWLAGVTLAALASGPWALRLLAGGQHEAAAVALAGLLAVPALALACGVVGGSSRLFEGLFVALWYVGPANQVPALDWLGITTTDGWLRAGGLTVATVVLLSLAAFGRHRQLAGG